MITLKNLTLRRGARVLLDDASCTINPGERVGLVGRNGAGKSTLFRMIAGQQKPDSGEVKVGSTVKMAFVDQNRDDLANEKTVWEDVSGGLDMLNVGKFTMASRAARPGWHQAMRAP